MLVAIIATIIYVTIIIITTDLVIVTITMRKTAFTYFQN